MIQSGGRQLNPNLDRIVGSYGQNQKSNGRIIDSDDDIDALEDGTFMSNVKADFNSSQRHQSEVTDIWLQNKSELCNAL